MESLAALGVAAAVVQFVDFGSRLLTSTWDVYRDASGQGQDLRDFNTVNKDLNQWISPIRNALKNSASTVSPHQKLATEAEATERELRELCTTCDEIARDLEKVLPRTIKSLNEGKGSGDSSSKWTRRTIGVRFQMALEQHWNREKLMSMSNRLQEVHRKVMSTLQTYIWLATRDLPRSFEEFSRKQDEMILDIRTRLEEGQKTGPRIETQAEPASQHESSESLWLGALRQTDFFSRLADQAFDQHRTREDFGSIPCLEHTDLEFANSAQRVQTWLGFRYSSDREVSISDPFEETYAWALDPPLLTESGLPKWSDFPAWLSNHAGDEASEPFWVTGKPGSGKSTMLKFLVNEDRTKQHLQKWAGRLSLEILTFYAWKPGQDLSKSMEGLLRTFLYQLITKHPELTPTICPRHWEYAFYVRGLSEVIPPPTPTWALEESFDTFLALEQTAVNFKLAIFIDGLDEFEEAPQTFCDLVQRLSKHPLIKVCVASREWKEFNHAFRSSPKIRMHELTENAISDFVTGRFEDPAVLSRVERLQRLTADGPRRIEKLINDILSNASGVFLWVTLVTNVVLQALVNQEPLDAVEKTLRAMPPEMKGLYDAILDSIPSELQPSTAWTLRLYQNITGPWDNNSFVFYLADESRGSRIRHGPDDQLDGKAVLGELEDRLAVRTRGILHQSATQVWEFDYPLGQVRTVHRTASEWLSQRRVKEKLEAHSKETMFNASFFWATAYLIQRLSAVIRDISIENRPGWAITEIDGLLQSLVANAERAEQQEITRSVLLQAIDEVETGRSTRPLLKMDSPPPEDDPHGPKRDLLLYCLSTPMLSLAQHLCKQYGIEKLDRVDSNFFTSFYDTTPMSHIVCSKKHLDLLQFLLAEGLTRRTAQFYLYCLFNTDWVTGGLTREPFDELMKKHFGSTRRMYKAKWRKTRERWRLTK